MWARLVLLASMGLSLCLCVHAQDDDITRSMTVTCRYSGYARFEMENVEIRKTTVAADAATVKTFERAQGSQTATLTVPAGTYAECVYPSGTRVRVKVGDSGGRPYGMCGGDGQVFVSLWVNERKLASREWFTGHCRGSSGEPAVTYVINHLPPLGAMTVRKCHEAVTGADATPANPQASRAPLSVCVEYPGVDRFPIDEIEYPRAGAEPPPVGAHETVTGTHAVCGAVRSILESRRVWRTEYSQLSSADAQPIEPVIPWTRSSVELPQELRGSQEAVFDFDNDGSLDRVLRREFMTNYQHGTVLLVQPGTAAAELRVPESTTIASSGLYPCQVQAKPDTLSCPPFSQANDEAGFDMDVPGQDAVHFRGRYSLLEPFRFQRETFVRANRTSVETDGYYYAILKPKPQRQFEQVCLLRMVTENF